MIKLKSDLGYLEGFTNLQKGRIVKQFEKIVRYNNDLYNYKDYIVIRILEGFNTIKIKENYTYYKRNGEISKPKTLYLLENSSENSYIELNKTLFNFASWLINNNFTTKEKINEIDNITFKKLEQIKIDEERREAEEIAKKNELKKLEENFKKELEQKVIDYNNKEKLELAKNIHINEYGEFYLRSAKLILVLIENLDKKLYKDEIKNMLHLDNKASRKIFECVTGLKLPKTLKGTREFLESITSKNFKGMKEFKARNNNKESVKLEKFIIRKGFDGSNLEVVEGEKLDYLGFTFYINKDKDDKYSITEKLTGLQIVDDTNKTRLLKKLKDRININNINMIKNSIEGIVNKYGELPEAI